MPGIEFWSIYKLFYSPPTTPPDLRCIGCRVASGFASLGLMAVSFYGMKRTFKSNVFFGTTFGAAGFILAGSAGIAFKMAYDDNIYNEKLAKRFAEDTRRKRGETSMSLRQETRA